MKIVFYIGSMYRGGAERVMSLLVNEMAKKYDVVLINDVRPILNEYKVDERVKRIFLEELGKGKKGNLLRLKWLRDIIKNEKPDALISFLEGPNIRMLLSTIGLKCRKIVSVRSDPRKEYQGIPKFALNCVFGLADGCVFQTSEAMNYFGNCIRKKGVIIANPIDEVFFKTQRNDLVCNIVTIGRLTKEKNHINLIKAYEMMLSRRGMTDQLLIYGEGCYKEELKRFINEHNLSEKVFLMGNTGQSEGVLKSSKLFVLSSDYEGMPNVLMEAMAEGVPVVSTDCPVGGPRNLLGEMGNETLVPVGNPEALAEKMERMLVDNELREKVTQYGKKRSQDFRIDKIVKEWEDILDL